jgi:hypothetical protein
MADTSLWPVVLTGVFTLVGSLGGIGVGLVGAARRDAAQDRRDAKKRRAEKFEELVAAVYEFDHWLTGIRDREAVGVHVDGPQTVSPFSKVEAISSVYFPQFIPLIDELDDASVQYLIWINEAMLKRVSKVATEKMAAEQPKQTGDEAGKFARDLAEAGIRWGDRGYFVADGDGYAEASGPYVDKRQVLLVALSEFAREHFQ